MLQRASSSSSSSVPSPAAASPKKGGWAIKTAAAGSSSTAAKAESKSAAKPEPDLSASATISAVPPAEAKNREVNEEATLGGKIKGFLQRADSGGGGPGSSSLPIKGEKDMGEKPPSLGAKNLENLPEAKIEHEKPRELLPTVAARIAAVNAETQPTPTPPAPTRKELSPAVGRLAAPQQASISSPSPPITLSSPTSSIADRTKKLGGASSVAPPTSSRPTSLERNRETASPSIKERMKALESATSAGSGAGSSDIPPRPKSLGRGEISAASPQPPPAAVGSPSIKERMKALESSGASAGGAPRPKSLERGAFSAAPPPSVSPSIRERMKILEASPAHSQLAGDPGPPPADPSCVSPNITDRIKKMGGLAIPMPMAMGKDDLATKLKAKREAEAVQAVNAEDAGVITETKVEPSSASERMQHLQMSRAVQPKKRRPKAVARPFKTADT
jgi:hypothetical protein